MYWLIALCAGGIIAGLLLLRRIPTLQPDIQTVESDLRVSVIIPARNEEANLPALLASIETSKSPPVEVIVVDDGSTDATTAVAAAHGAKILTSSRLPEGWTGKNWACQQGALAAVGDAVLFVDADTRFAGDGYERAVAYYSRLPANAALSILPYHQIKGWYEELSLYFNILMAMGAGGFGGIDAPRLFGQSIMLRKELYWKAGGHRSVREEVIEAPHFSSHLHAAGGRTYTLGGSGSLEMRMFPHGVGQLTESWRKGFAAGAGASSAKVLALSIYWLSASALTVILLVAAHGIPWQVRVAMYLLFALLTMWQSRQLGKFRWVTALAYPVPLAFYFIVFSQSAWRRLSKKPVTWKGRQV